MSRAVRTARGFGGAVIATLFAAASHALGGGRITPIAVVATIVLALPLCVALAGRLASLWRLAVAVGASQFLFHWCFAALGSAPTSAGGSAPNPHAAHFGPAVLGPVPPAPELLASGAADASMWASHALAALVTVALLYRGERAALGLMRLIRRARPFALPRATAPVPRPRIRASEARTPLRAGLCPLSPISHRGPPATLALLIPSR